MIVPRSTSPHPSLSSSGSEEVRCSLDELDAVIATFDEEARRQRQNFICARSAISTFCSKSMANNQLNQRRSSLSMENQSSSVVVDPMDYASATLQNPRRSQTRPSPGTCRLPTEHTVYDVNTANEDNDFPPPPTDLFVSDNFVLPPPPPPTALELEADVMQATDACVRPTVMDTVIPSGINAVASTASTTNPAVTNPLQPAQSAMQNSRPCAERLGPASACKRPMVPQRAPSTRLSSVPVVAVVYNGTDDPRPRSMAAADPSIPSTESLPNPIVKSSSADRVSVGASTTVMKPTTTVATTQNTEVVIDQTVPPVSDIIRKFDRPGTVPGPSSCRSVPSQSRPANGVPREARVHPVSPTHNQSTIVRKSSSPGNLSAIESLPRPASSGPDGDCPDFSPSPTVQELARGFAFSGRTTNTSTEVGPTGTVSRACELAAKMSQQVSPFPIGRVPVDAISSMSGQTHTQKLSSPSGNFFFAPQSHCTMDPHLNCSSGQTPLSSFGSTRQMQTNGVPRSSPPLPSPPPMLPVQPTAYLGRSNSITSGQIDSPDSPVPSCSPSGFVSVNAMRLNPETLETLLQYNIVGAHQIPGYQPVPGGLPDWKMHKLERKNRDAADAYAIDLRKWGCVPQWKRELIEKRQHGKMDSPTTKTHSTTHEAQPESQSLVSAELTEKLQRRLQKVASIAEP